MIVQDCIFSLRLVTLFTTFPEIDVFKTVHKLFVRLSSKNSRTWPNKVSTPLLISSLLQRIIHNITSI